MAGSHPVNTVVFPVAGQGTRFLPATRAVPKELLPVVDKPLLQYAVEEAVEAGARKLVLVVSPGKRSIIRHFRRDPKLEQTLEDAGKSDLLEKLRSILPSGVSIVEAVQEQPLGLGHAVLCAREHIADEPFFGVILPDDVLRRPEGPGGLAQLHEVHQRTGASVLGVERVAPELTASYGIVEIAPADDLQPIIAMVEKPAPEQARSNLAVVGRYLLDARIFSLLETQQRGAGGEIQLTDGIARMLDFSSVYAHTLLGQRYDCGQTMGMLKANIDFALDNPELRPVLLQHLAKIAGQEP